ncbi:extracellular catalytic domain type 1 short-chain-length polyhydroxyalkanoate depolymerase [Paraburkholderia adhaesiva]|uniref:extracellular catalytic domain type 1 short-chain-length polyhydroxyalkanoate depolymerase n=1 Tax=Paraburkholderia adhaesiva TaxID=2883244 RepID=UPI001F359337|nr:PHB depolymerase family esterase [Paraburkholderia adhaesiva]
MTNNLTKLWATGVRRLLAVQTRAARTMMREAARHTKHPPPPWRDAQTGTAQAPGTGAPRAAAARAVASHKATSRMATPATPPRESRVGPRAAAWAAGEWRRAEHIVPATPQRASRALHHGLYLPANRRTAGMPLVVMLHGCKQSMDTFAEGTRMNLLADRYGFAVVYPEQSELAHPHQCWHWYDARDEAGGGEAAAVVSLVDALLEEYGFDASRVYLAGLSAGAGLAALLAVRAPGRFAAVALHSGPAFGEASSGVTALDVMRRGLHKDPVELLERQLGDEAHPGMPAIVVQGDDDGVVAPINAEQLTVQFLRLNGLADSDGVRPDVRSREAEREGFVVQDYARRGASVVRLCRVADLDHAWSGGDDAVPFHSATGPDASAMIWSFFEGHRREAANDAWCVEPAKGTG